MYKIIKKIIVLVVIIAMLSVPVFAVDYPVRAGAELSFELYKANYNMDDYVWEKGNKINASDSLSPGDRVMLDIVGSGVSGATGMELTATFDNSRFSVVGSVPFVEGDTANGYLDLYSLIITNQVIGNKISFNPAPEANAITADNVKLGYIVLKVNTAAEDGISTFSYDSTSTMTWNDGQGNQFYSINASPLSVNIGDPAAILQAAIDAVNGADASTMAQVIADNNAVLGLGLTGDYADLNDQLPVHTALAGKNFTTIEAIKTAFNTAVAAQKASEADAAAIQGAIDAVNTADVSAMASVLVDNNNLLGLDLTGDYGDLNDQSPVHEALAGKSFTTIEAIKTAFNNAVAAQKSAEAAEIQGAIDAVNGADANTMAQVIADNNDILGLNLTGDYAGLKDQSPVHTALAGKSFTTVEAIKTAFNTAVAVQKASEADTAAIQGAIDAVNGADASTMAQVLADNNAVLGLNLTGDYGDLNDKSPVHTALAGKNFTTIEAIKTAFNTAVAAQKASEADAAAIQGAIDAVNGADASAMAQVLIANNTVLGLNLNGDYVDLNDQSPVHTALAGKNFTTIEAIKTAFNTAVAAQKAMESATAAVEEAVALVSAGLDSWAEFDAASTAYAQAREEVDALASESDKAVFDNQLSMIADALDMAYEILRAIDAIDNLPATSVLTAADKADVEAARALVQGALAIGATESQITNISVLVAAEEKMLTFARGYLGGIIEVIGVDYNEADVTVTILMNGTELSTAVVDFIDSTATLPANIIEIPTMDISNPEIMVLIKGCAGEEVLAGNIIVNDGDTLDIGTINVYPGDTNRDGAVDKTDLDNFANYFMESTTERAVDFNGDGKVNVEDLYFIGKYYYAK